MRGIAFLAMAALLAAVHAPAAAEEEKHSPDTGRFYLFVETGHAILTDTDFAGDADLDIPGGWNFFLGGGGGYNISDHWGVEIQADGTEPDVRSSSLGKLTEFSNITLIPAVRFRIPFLDNKLVTYATAGVGYSISDLNDTADLKIKVDMTPTKSVVGAVGAGVEYFLAEDVAFGVGARYFVYPNADTEIIVRDQANRIVADEHGSVSLNSVALLAHLRLYPGQPATPGQPRRLLLADHGPFDTGDPRFYIYALGGDTFTFDDDFGGGVTLEAPGDFNATLGGGLGVNFDRHWGFEVQLVHTEPNIDVGAEGKTAELANLTVLPSVRWRWPFLGGRLVPSVSAGFGASFNHINDTRQTADVFVSQGSFASVPTPIVRVDKSSIAGTVGLGLEYFLNHHLSVGLSVPLYVYPSWDTYVQRFDGQGRPLAPVRDTTNFTGVAALFQIKAYVP